MKSLFKIVAWLLGILVLLVGLAAVLVPVLFDPNDYKDEVAAAVKEQTGRELRIPGDLAMTVFPWLGVEVGEVELGNAPGFSDEVFARSMRAQVRVKLMPLLERRLEMDTVTLHGLQVNLERDASGKTNWADLAAAAADGPQPGADSSAPRGGDGPALAALALGGIDVVDARLSWSDAVSGQKVQLSDVNLRTGALTLDAPVDVEGNLQLSVADPPVTGGVILSTRVHHAAGGTQLRAEALTVALDLRGPTLPGGELVANLGTDVALDTQAGTASLSALQLAVADLRASGALQASGLNGTPAVTGNIEVASFNLRELLAALGQSVPATADTDTLTAVSLQTQLAASPTSLSLEPLQVQLDDSTLKGTLAVSDLAAPALRFDLGIDAIDADRYLPPEAAGGSGAGPGANGAGGPGAATPGAAAAAAAELPLEMLRALDVQGTLRLGQLSIRNMSLADLAATLTAKDGNIRLSPVAARLYGGAYAGNIGLDVRGEVPRISLDESIDGVQLSPLLADLQGEDRLEGTASAKLAATATGAGADAIKQSLDGNGEFRFTDGALKGINVAAMLREARARITGTEADTAGLPQRTDFSEMGGTFVIRDGVLSNDDFAAKSPLLRVTGEGSVDLARETIDYRPTVSVVATAQGQGGSDLGDLAGLDVPVKIGGTFAEPTYGVDVEALASSLVSARVEGVVAEQKEKVTEAVQEKVGEALGGSVGKLLGGSGASEGATEGAAGSESGSTGGDAADAAGKALRGLFGN